MKYLNQLFVRKEPVPGEPLLHVTKSSCISDGVFETGIVNMVFRISIQSVLICFLLLLTANNFAWSQQKPPNIKSIPLPTGSGARALGQGGAFIAVADDATAASWNPAGLIQLERPEFSVVGSYLTTDQNFSVRDDSLSLAFKDTLDNEDVGRWDANFLSIAFPFRFLKKNFVTALNYHQVLDFHTDINFRNLKRDRKGMRFVSRQIDFKSSGGIGVLSPSIAMLLLPKLSFGLTVNIYDDEYFNSHGWTQTLTSPSTVIIPTGGSGFQGFKQKISSKDYHGVNVSLGLMWDLWEKEDKSLTFGAVFHSAYTARFDQESKNWSQAKSLFRNGIVGGPDISRSSLKMDWPMSVGLGIEFKFSDALSFSLDLNWTDWSEWKQKSKPRGGRSTPGFTPQGPENPNSRPIGSGTEHDELDDTFSARFGTEYLMFMEKDIVAFRGGLFFEQRPSLGDSAIDSRSTSNNAVNPDGDPMDVIGFSLGTGFSTKRYSIDAAYQFRYVRDMEGSNIGLPGTEIDTTENLWLASLIIYM